MTPERWAFYQLEAGDIVRVTAIDADGVRLRDPETRETWTVQREPFEARLADGYIQRVRRTFVMPPSEREA